MFILQVRFLYAGSREPGSGPDGPLRNPVVLIPVDYELYKGDRPDLLERAVQDTVRLMDKAGADYHHVPSMPSSDGEDYRLVIHHPDGEETLVSRSEQLMFETDQCTGTPYPYTRGLELMYVGLMGQFQIEQCLKLGGPASVEVAMDAWHRGQRLLELERERVA